MRLPEAIGHWPLAVGILLSVAVSLPPASAAAQELGGDPIAAQNPSADSIPDSIPALADTGADSAVLSEPAAADDDELPADRVPEVNAGDDQDAAAQLESCPLGPHRRTAQVAVGGVFLGANLELFRRFKNAWWSGEKSDGFFFNADWGEAFRDQDKFGHMYGGYHLTRGGYTLLRAACVSQGRAIAYGAAYAMLFLLQIELWDAQYEKYGFSYPDMIGNTVGTGLAVLHALRPETEMVKPTISYRRTAAMKDQQPGDEIRHSTDYSGQTYWLSLDMDAALPDRLSRYWPGILRVSLGHSITDYVLPRPPGTPPDVPQQVVTARRRILLSLDLDAGRLPGDHPVWNFVKRQLSFIRLPGPALQLTPDVEFIRWYR